MQAEVILPDLGPAPVILSVWFADAGDQILEGDRLVEVMVDAATFDVASPATGKLMEKRALPDDRLVPGQVLGIVETDA